MVFDRLEDCARYRPLHPRLGQAFAWLSQLTLDSSPGRYTLEGEVLYANLDEAQTEPARTRRFESHAQYIDLQLSLAGGELIEWAPAGTLPVAVDFEPGGDIAFHVEPIVAPASIRLLPGSFALFFPGEAHRPLCALECGPRPVRKVVVKLKV